MEKFAAENCGPWFIYLCVKYNARLFAGLLLCMEWNVLRSCSLEAYSTLARLMLLYPAFTASSIEMFRATKCCEYMLHVLAPLAFSSFG